MTFITAVLLASLALIAQSLRVVPRLRAVSPGWMNKRRVAAQRWSRPS